MNRKSSIACFCPSGLRCRHPTVSASARSAWARSRSAHSAAGSTTGRTTGVVRGVAGAVTGTYPGYESPRARRRGGLSPAMRFSRCGHDREEWS
ncbi:Uncharacterised protein [Mycobacteroides abscessus]|nr:Uncharacterised protein [Mycobacteroides abscessus]